MERTEYLNKVQFYKNAIDVYSGSDPLKPRYEYIMWLEKNVGKENADVNICLEHTLQRFQNEACYANDPRFVELLILFTRLKGDKLSYFKKLFECNLGAKCSIFYKAWSDELLICHKYLKAYDVLKSGIYNKAQPLDLITNAQRDIEILIGKKILLGNNSCELLKVACSCYQLEAQKEVLEVKNWELNTLKPGQPDNFTCPLLLPEPDDPHKLRIYAKHLVYFDSGENQFEEVQAHRYFQKIKNAKVKHSQDDFGLSTSNSARFAASKEPHLFGDVSCDNQSYTAHTKVAYNLVQGMWDSPSASGEINKPNGNFKIPDVPKTGGLGTPIQCFTDSFSKESEHPGTSKNTVTGSKVHKSGLSSGKVSALPLGERHPIGVERSAVKHQLVFGDIQDENMECDLATKLDRNACNESTVRCKIPDDWNVDDLTCNTKIFTNFYGISSTPNTKGKENVAISQSNGQGQVATCQKTETGILSVILEASKETPNSGSSGNENKVLNVLDIERTLDNLDINANNPFCPKLQETLLKKVNYPNCISPVCLKNYHVISNKLPNITKTLKLGENVYSLTGESFKGAYAKVMKVSCNDKFYALKIEKPPSHWEYYICKEIRKRLGPENLHYFADISSAFFYQNGSFLLSDYAKYGTLLNVINQYKLSPSKPDTSIALFLCMEVISAVHYLNSQCNIIHADIKPDNFVVFNLPTLNSTGPYIQLIDFGRSIDMRLMPKGCEFNYVVTTDGFQCNEMKENRPWTYQTDLFGLAGTMYCILVGDYMKVVKKKDNYILSRQLPRVHQSMWNPIFQKLLNIDSSSNLPDLMEIWNIIREAYESINSFTVRSSFNALINILHGN